MHSDQLTGIVIVGAVAFLCGLAMTRLRQPPVVGYILAGIILGPSGFALVQSREAVETLADLGVLTLLFLIGLELSLRAVKDIWRVVLLSTLLQIAVSIALVGAVSPLFGWSAGTVLALAFVVFISSTAIAIKLVEQLHILHQPVGQLVVGIVIAQDLAVVPMMLTLQMVAKGAFDPIGLAKVVLSVGVLFGLVFYLSRRKRIVLPFTKALEAHPDLWPIAGLTFCLGVAAFTALVGLSPALGAFLAGLVIGNSTARAETIRGTWPIQSVLLMIFFVAIGLLIDLNFVWRNLGSVLLLLGAVVLVKTALNIGILFILREPWPHAFFAGVLLAQMGEFSFVIGREGARAGLLSEDLMQLIVAVTALSLLISPLWVLAARRLLRLALIGVQSFRITFDVTFGMRFARARRGPRWRRAWRKLQRDRTEAESPLAEPPATEPSATEPSATEPPRSEQTDARPPA
ncbi:MAG: cation:proton antiporter [Alphaproteobacteria bacterium]